MPKSSLTMPPPAKTHIIPAAALTLLLLISNTNSTSIIPQNPSKLDTWFNSVVKPYNFQKTTLDPALATAEASIKVIKVRKDGGGDFKTIKSAVDAVPTWNKVRTVIWIGPGIYKEKIVIAENKPFVTLYGSPNEMPSLVYNDTAETAYGTVNSATLSILSDYFVAANLIVVNSAPMPDGREKGAQAVALKASGDKQAFYNCRIVGNQDTLLDDKGHHFFKDCYVEGTVDFIFGSGKSIYLRTELNVLRDNGTAVITAQGRKLTTEDQGYSFVHCKVTGKGNGTAYLGRAWMESSMVVFSYTTMAAVVNPDGWSDNSHQDRDKKVFFGEYKCMGPGSDLNGRVKYMKVLNDVAAKRFLSLDYIHVTSWLLPPPNL